MDEHSLEEIWLGLNDNIVLKNFIFDSIDKVLEDQTIQSIERELKLNNTIADDILPKIQQQNKSGKKMTQFNFTDIKTNPRAILKYVRHQKQIRLLDLSDQDLSHSDIELLIHGIEEHNEDLNILKLNHNKNIDDEIIEEIKKLIRGKTPLSELELDGTVVTERGLE